jgi:beta-glucanase (GH16 family)
MRIVVLAACSALLAGAQPAGKLVFADEFDREGKPDPARWTYEIGFVRNQELQWYQPENARCQNGLLIIEARRERKDNPDHQPGSASWRLNRPYAEYTSASLSTKGLQSWRYGRFEMRGRIDTRPGLWPAFWTVGAEGRWPASVDGLVLNETDLKETLNPDGTNPFRKPHYIILNLAVGGSAGGDPGGTEFPARFEVDYVRVYQ